MKFKTYVIKKGKHSPFLFPKLTFSNSLSYIVEFTESCRYNLKGSDQYDINKLPGLADNWSHHHWNSMRLGWRYNISRDSIELFTYSYVNKKRLKEKFIRFINISKPILVTQTITKDSYRYVVGSLYEYEKRKRRIMFGLKYITDFYFGGDKPAPHDIQIKLKRL